MAIPVVEITVGDPKKNWRDQLLSAYIRKDIDSPEYSRLHSALFTAEHEGRLPTSSAAAVKIALDGGRQVLVRKYGAQTQAPGSVTYEPGYRSPSEEVERKCKALQDAHPGLSRDEAQSRVFRENPGLYERHVEAQRAGQGNVRGASMYNPNPAPALTAKAVLKQVDEMVKKDGSLSKRAVLEKLVQDNPREPAYLQAYRAFHLGQGLDEHHGGGAQTREPRERTTYDAMWHVGRE
jgi:hypothetical protein